MGKKQKVPRDLEISILLRLPTKSLLRFRSVCKTWLKLLTIDTNFIHLHVHHSNTRKTGFLVRLPLRGEEQRKEKSDFKYVEDLVSMDKYLDLKLPFGKSINDRLWLYGITNGLLYLRSKDETSPLYIWNPFTGDHTAIACPPIPHGRGYPFFGFGYDRVTNQYKVIRLLPPNSTSTTYVDSSSSLQVDLYTLGIESSWRRLEDIRYGFPSTDVTFISGSLHWLADSAVNPQLFDIILSFSIKDEIFQEMPRPKQLSFDRRDYVSIGELDKFLCMYYGVSDEFCEVWVMRDYGVPDSWTKKFKIDRSMVNSSFLGSSPICSIGDGCILKEDGNFGYTKLVFYNKKERSMTLWYFPVSFCQGYNYSSSLVSPSIIDQFNNEK